MMSASSTRQIPTPRTLLKWPHRRPQKRRNWCRPCSSRGRIRSAVALVVDLPADCDQRQHAYVLAYKMHVLYQARRGRGVISWMSRHTEVYCFHGSFTKAPVEQPMWARSDGQGKYYSIVDCEGFPDPCTRGAVLHTPYIHSSMRLSIRSVTHRRFA